MTLCPIAIAVGCKKCPAFSVCPVKTTLGDMPKADASPSAAAKSKSASPAAKSKKK
jgi:hypothetical protein